MSVGDVSVVIPCRNAEAWVAEAVASAVGQGAVVGEIILVDDGSNDRSVEVAERAAPGRLTVIRQQAGGVSRARNAGTARATRAFVQYLDADDILTAGTVAARVHALVRTGADVAYADWVRWQRDAAGQFGPGDAVVRTLGSRPDVELLTDAWWPPGALLYRRAIVERLLPWREDLPVIQDARFLHDAAIAGAAFVHVSGIGLRYRVHGNQSLSRRDPGAFVADCYRNVCDLHERWRTAGALDAERREALLRAYTHVLRGTFRHDRALFETALARVRDLEPRFVPDEPRALRWLSRAIGYRAAEHVAAIWRAGRAAGT
jgi:glycosyltransferase involved in cell wall biosynthesis